MFIRFDRFQPFMKRAIDLVTKGFQVPVPFLDNHSPTGRAIVRTFNAFPELARRGSFLYMASGSADGFVVDTESVFGGNAFWHSPLPIPAGLFDVLEGKRGEPAGPDVNEVSGHSVQDFMAARPIWSKIHDGNWQS
jgi:hypothetical protein